MFCTAVLACCRNTSDCLNQWQDCASCPTA
jgi:hypothetical protein